MSYKFVVSDEASVLRDKDDRIVAKENTSNLSKTFLGVNRAPIGLMPPAIRWISGDGHSYLVERPPVFMTINYTDAPAHKAAAMTPTSYVLALPWTTYLVCFADIASDQLARLQIYGRTEPLRTINDELCYLPLPNSDPLTYGGVCLGHGFAPLFSKQMKDARNNGRWDAAYAVISAINLFWQINFNADMGLSRYQAPKSTYNNGTLWHPDNPGTLMLVRWLERWASMTLADALSMDWAPGPTVSAILPSDNTVNAFNTSTLAGYLYRLIKSGKV